MAIVVQCHLNKFGIVYSPYKNFANFSYLCSSQSITNCRSFGTAQLLNRKNATNITSLLLQQNNCASAVVQQQRQYNNNNNNSNNRIIKNLTLCRDYSSSSHEPRIPKLLPEMMAFPNITWPSVFKSIKNWILVHFIIRPYFDREFTIPDFVAGTKHALQVF